LSCFGGVDGASTGAFSSHQVRTGRCDRGSPLSTPSSSFVAPSSSRQRIHLEFLVDPAQCSALRDWVNPALGKDRCGLRVLHHRSCGKDGVRTSKVLNPRGDIHGLPKVVLTIIQGHGKAWPFMDANLQQQVLASALGIQPTHRRPHPQRSRQGAVGGREGRHDRIPNRLDHGPGLSRDNLLQHAEMGADEIKGGARSPIRS
jgi:hypothetical protein